MHKNVTIIIKSKAYKVKWIKIIKENDANLVFYEQGHKWKYRHKQIFFNHNNWIGVWVIF